MKEIVDDPVSAAMVASINQIGHVMGLRTVAEFVENEDIVERLRGIGVDFAQGYGIARPEPFTDWIARSAPPTTQSLAPRAAVA